MPWPKFDRLRRWLLPAALLAAVPKCALCLLTYAGLGTALGLGGPELCGGVADRAYPDWLAGAIAASALVGLLVPRLVRRFPATRP